MIAKYGGEFLSTGTYASLGKVEGIKKNYGDVSVQRTRNTEALRKLREEYEQMRSGETDPAG
jgi:hypothetical protein